MTAGPAGERVRSRARRAKAVLSLDAVVGAALDLLDREGHDAVTMRRVAQALDTGPASLYVYVANRDELLRLVLDRALAEVPLTGDGDWRTRLRTLIRAQIEVLTRHRGLAFVAMADIPSGLNALAINEYALALLAESDLDEQRIAWTVDLIGLYVNAAAAEQTMHLVKQEQGRVEESYVAAIARQYANLPAERFPQIRRLSGPLFVGSGEQRFSWGLDVLINGILHTPID